MDFDFDFNNTNTPPTTWATGTTDHRSDDIPDPPDCARFFSLYGPGTTRAPILGSAAVLDELTQTIDRDRLFIQRPATSHPTDVIKIAYHHLQQHSLFPQAEEITGLRSFSPSGDSAMGIELRDPVLDIADAVTGKPPFRTRDVDCILGALRILARQHEECTNDFFEQPQEFSYRLGVVTLLLDASGRPKFTAQLLPSREGVVVMGTLWLFRWCAKDGSGACTEAWRAFGDGTFDMETLGEPDRVFRSPPEPLATAPEAPHILERAGVVQTPHVDADDYAEHPAREPRPHQPSSTALSDEQLFAHDPDRIRGAAILRLARFYSNTELFERVNAGLAARGAQGVASANVITRRITLAIQAKAAKSEGLTIALVRRELNEARRANGVRARMNARAQETRGANRGGGGGDE
ncbi:hypothetical protein LTR08_000069 [Meristemomyces frigidus]|nr:hypothetical protein LTR08_000069 [Meristemomyces frigidus]